jgi:hypothetical protein
MQRSAPLLEHRSRQLLFADAQHTVRLWSRSPRWGGSQVLKRFFNANLHVTSPRKGLPVKFSIRVQPGEDRKQKNDL